MDIVLKAKEFAIKAHEGQLSESGHPYILHPIWVMEHLDSDMLKIIGVLHDVLEDTNVSEKEILDNFGSEVLEILKIITKNKDEDYLAYIERVSKNKIASLVKIQDLRHNMDLSRKEKITDYDLFRIENKYKIAYKILTGHKLTLKEQLNTDLSDAEIRHLIWNLYSKRLKHERLDNNMYYILNHDSNSISDELKEYIEGVLNNEVLRY